MDPRNEHSDWGPSSAHRRIACRGSAEAEAGLPEVDTEERFEGTMLHDVLERVLRDGEEGDAYAYEGKEYPSVGGTKIEFSGDQASVVQNVADRVFETQGVIYPEVKVDLSMWIPDQHGTSDIGIRRVDSLRIRDAKFGRGDVVLAYRNPQLMLYAVGFWANVLCQDPEIDPEWMSRLEAGEIPVYLDIDQPYKGNFDTWKTDLPTCLRFAEEYAAIYRETQESSQPRTAGPSQCLYCKARSRCRTFIDYCLEVMRVSTEDLDTLSKSELAEKMDTNAEAMTPEQRANLVQAKALVTKMLEDVESSLRDDYMAGKPTGGLKLIPGANRRVWADEEQAREELLKRFKKKEVVTEKLASPAKVLKIAGPRQAKRIDSLIIFSETKPRLVPETHKTPGIPRAVDHFDDLSEEDLDFDLGLDSDLDFNLEM